MANIIVVSFKEETKAIEALHKVKDLDAYGDIILYEFMLIRKKENNTYVILNDDTSTEAWRTLTGMTLGGLLGALAGPLGLVVGLYSGTITGALWHNSHYDFEDDFIKKINNKMTIGDTTLIAEVNEYNSLFIDNALKPFNVEILRTDADAEYLDFIEDEIERLEDKIEDQHKKLKNASVSEKEKITSKITDLKAKRKSKIAKLESKGKSTLQELKDKTKTKIEKLEDKLENFGDSLAETMTKARANRLKKRISRQNEKLNRLNESLEDVLD